MPPIKRKSGLSYNARYKRARTQGRAYRGMVNVLTRSYNKRAMARPAVLTRTINRVNNLYKMMETKELTWTTAANQALAHNQTTQLADSIGNSLNIFRCTIQGAGDPMDANSGQRIGDQLTCKGVLIKGFFENALTRPKVFYRVMLLKGAKGDAFSRATIFKGDSNNKMMDQINTERYTVIAQKTFSITNSNPGSADVATAAGVPTTGATSQQWYGAIGTKMIKMWIPGYKFGNGGRIQYESGSVSQVKFFDYRVVVVVYDWYGTPQDINTVGRINELYTKTYFKDA